MDTLVPIWQLLCSCSIFELLVLNGNHETAFESAAAGFDNTCRSHGVREKLWLRNGYPHFNKREL